MHTHKGALKIITVEIEAYKARKAHTHPHTHKITHRAVVQAGVLRVGFRAASVPSGRKHSAFSATCLEWTNHADCVGEKPKMKAEREASCKKTAVPSLFLLIWLLIFSVAGKTTS